MSLCATLPSSLSPLKARGEPALGVTVSAGREPVGVRNARRNSDVGPVGDSFTSEPFGREEFAAARSSGGSEDGDHPGNDSHYDVEPAARLLFADGEYGAPSLHQPSPPDDFAYPGSARSVGVLARSLAETGAMAVADFSRRGSIMAGPGLLLPHGLGSPQQLAPSHATDPEASLAAARVEWTVTDRLAVALVASPGPAAASSAAAVVAPIDLTAASATDASVVSLSSAMLEPKLRQSRRRLMLATVISQSLPAAGTEPHVGVHSEAAAATLPAAPTEGTDEGRTLQRAPTFVLQVSEGVCWKVLQHVVLLYSRVCALQRLALSHGALKPLTYLEACASSPLYSDPELHARTIMLLFACMLTQVCCDDLARCVVLFEFPWPLLALPVCLQEGTALRDSVVTRGVRASSHVINAHRRGSGLVSNLSFSGAWGEGVFEGFAVTGRRGSNSSVEGSGGAAAAATAAGAGSRHALLPTRTVAGPMREADRDGSSATLQRFLSGKSFRASGSSLKRLAGAASSSVVNMSAAGAAVSAAIERGGGSLHHNTARHRSHHQLHQPLDGGGHSSHESPWDGLEAHPVYVLQCHLNHPGNTVLVNVQVCRGACSCS
jgi:hypothetical protein